MCNLDKQNVQICTDRYQEECDAKNVRIVTNKDRRDHNIPPIKQNLAYISSNDLWQSHATRKNASLYAPVIREGIRDAREPMVLYELVL